MVKKTFLIAIFLCNYGNSKSHNFSITEKTTVSIIHGDITQAKAGIIVNAANEQLLAGGGVCGAIFNAAGVADLQRACNNYPAQQTVRCPVGQAVITDSFDLKKRGIKQIIHAVGPDCRIIHNTKQQDMLLSQAYTNSLLLADQHACSSIAFPFISSAIYAFPKKRAANIALTAILDYVHHSPTTIDQIQFVLYSQEDFELFNKTIRTLLD